MIHTMFSKLLNPSTSNINSAESRRSALTKLKFIGQLKPNEKIDNINVKVEDTSIWTPFKRFVYGDGRKNTLNFFSSTVERVFEIIDANVHSKKISDKIFCSNIIQDLITSIDGLRSAQKTYEADKFFHCEIAVLIENIQAKVFELQKDYPDLFNVKELCIPLVDDKGENSPKNMSFNNPPEDRRNLEKAQLVEPSTNSSSSSVSSSEAIQSLRQKKDKIPPGRKLKASQEEMMADE